MNTTEYIIQETYEPVAQPAASIKIGDIEFDQCLADEYFYISRTAPFIFANANGTIIKQSTHVKHLKLGDYKFKVVQCQVNNNKHGAMVHRLIAQQYIINDAPERKTEIDHRDRNACNNDINNLRWVTPRLNNFNRITDARQYFLDHLSPRAISISSFNGHQLDDDEANFWFDPEDNTLYVQVDVNSFRSFVLSSRNRFSARDVDGTRVNIPLKQLQAQVDE